METVPVAARVWIINESSRQKLSRGSSGWSRAVGNSAVPRSILHFDTVSTAPQRLNLLALQLRQHNPLRCFSASQTPLISKYRLPKRLTIIWVAGFTMRLMRPLLVLFMLSLGAATAAPGFLTPQALAIALKHKSFTFINVHVPFEGAIAGTDAFIPFDAIKGSPRLPRDHAAQIVLYCRSGQMSAIAHATLHTLGYTNVRELKGGFNAWKQAGFPLKQR
jgi:phage shock protein E